MARTPPTGSTASMRSTAATATPNAAAMTPVAMAPEARFGRRRPNVALTRKPSERKQGDQEQHGRHHFSDVKLSGLSESLCRKSAITIARPTAASAAATVMTKNTMICPSIDPR